jgi:sulfite exporter TauE/SafE
VQSLVLILSVGFLLGLKHATEADHVVAVSTFVSRERSLLRSCWIGLFWGAGHTLSLAFAGSLILLLKINISESLAGQLELLVATMLIVLGVRVLYRTWKDRMQLHRHIHSHAPGKAGHAHWHVHSRRGPDEHSGWLHVGLRPLVVGMVHGAAGTGALMLLVLSTIHSPVQALMYILVFGVGSIAGMLIVSLLLAAPLQWLARRTASGPSLLHAVAGVFSCVFGVYLALGILLH